ncbi:MAG: diguanylate cyclase [Desulfuromonadaceae bacterium]|nr:diguanylate cyclase [Desulfuromonadaceae bacterium]
MRRLSHIVCCSLISLVACLMPFPVRGADVPAPASQRVLLLNSYHQNMSWTQSITQSIEERFKAFPIELYIESLDSKRQPLELVWPTMHSYLGAKYGPDFFDAIIVSDNNALQFMNCERQRLFPDVPLVFCGVNHFHPRLMSLLESRVAGVTEEISVRKTVELMQRLQPRLKRVVMVSGTTETAALNQIEASMQLESRDNSLQVEYWHGLGKDELLARLMTLSPEQDGVLLLAFTRDADGHYYSFKTQGLMLAKASTAPVYSLWEFYQGTGVLGGALIRGQDQGLAAANLCLKVLRGELTSVPQAEKGPPGVYMVDAKVLARFGIPERWLPPETVVLNRQHSFYRLHQTEFLLALSTVGLLLLLSLGLQTSRRRLTRIIDEMGVGEARLRTVLNSIGDGVLAMDRKGLLLGLNPVAEKLIGVSPLECVGQRAELFFSLVDTRSQQPLNILARATAGLEEPLPLPEHTTLLTSAKKAYQVSGTVAPLRDDHGHELGLVLALRDISDDYALRQQLRDSQKRFIDITNSLNDILILLDPQLRVQLMNKAGMRAYQVDPDNYVGKLCHELFWDCPIPCDQCPSLQVMKDGRISKAMRFRDDGTVLARTIYPVYAEDGRLSGTAVIASDVTERYHAEQALKQSQEQLLDVANSMPGAIFQLRVLAEGTMQMNYVGEGIRPLAGLSDSEDIMNPVVLLKALARDDRRRILRSTMRAARRKRLWEDEFRFALPDGIRWVHGKAYPRPEADGSIVYNGVLTDITKRKQMEEKLQHQVYHDHLTGLANGVLYRDRLTQALHRASRHNEQLAVIMLDLDRFKEINDTLGHAAGDVLLQQVSRRLEGVLRRDDTVARLGGDEFMVLVEGLHQRESLEGVLEKMVQSFVPPFDLDGTEVTIGSSIGISLYPMDGVTVDDLIKHADIAMYQCKRQGGQRYCFYADATDSQPPENPA